MKMLDAIALASFDTPTRVQRIAALWCRAFNNRFPESRTELSMWVEHEFGPVLDSEEHRSQLAKLLLDETRRQIKIRRRRKRLAEQAIDHLTTPAGSGARLGHLLQSRLGPARAWVSANRIRVPDSNCFYIDGAVISGLVAGIIPVMMRTRRFVDPCLLVYRQGKKVPKSWWVPGHITTVADAFIWVIPGDVAEFLRLPETRVEHDGEAQKVRLITQFGTKCLPWRELSPP